MKVKEKRTDLTEAFRKGLDLKRRRTSRVIDRDPLAISVETDKLNATWICYEVFKQTEQKGISFRLTSSPGSTGLEIVPIIGTVAAPYIKDALFEIGSRILKRVLRGKRIKIKQLPQEFLLDKGREYFEKHHEGEKITNLTSETYDSEGLTLIFWTSSTKKYRMHISHDDKVNYTQLSSS